MEKYPNWLEIPDELMSNILQRLGTKEILERARGVCTAWRKICENPEMWKVIVMHKELSDRQGDYHFEWLTKHAVLDLSCGKLIGVGVKRFAIDELLDHIVLRFTLLGRSGLNREVKSMPQLEELGISYISIDKEDIKVIGQNCLQLKTFMASVGLRGTFKNKDDNAFSIANNMPELCRLRRYDLDLDGNLRKLCMERIKDFRFHLEVEDNNYYDEISGNYSD
ncbi:hypothetical protein LXL04_027573 [Taraxacum kok-saghyz]